MQYDLSGQNSWLRRYERRLALRGVRVTFDPFTYSFPFSNPVGVSATVSATIPTDRDSDFFVLAPMVQAFDNVGPPRVAIAIPDHSFQLKLQTSGRLFDDRAVAVTNWFGTAQRPHRLSVPLLIPASSQITMTLINNVAAATNVFYSLVGVKAFHFPVGGRDAEDLREELGLGVPSRLVQALEQARALQGR